MFFIFSVLSSTQLSPRCEPGWNNSCIYLEMINEQKLCRTLIWINNEQREMGGYFICCNFVAAHNGGIFVCSGTQPSVILSTIESPWQEGPSAPGFSCTSFPSLSSPPSSIFRNFLRRSWSLGKTSTRIISQQSI